MGKLLGTLTICSLVLLQVSVSFPQRKMHSSVWLLGNFRGSSMNGDCWILHELPSMCTYYAREQMRSNILCGWIGSWRVQKKNWGRRRFHYTISHLFSGRSVGTAIDHCAGIGHGWILKHSWNISWWVTVLCLLVTLAEFTCTADVGHMGQEETNKGPWITILGHMFWHILISYRVPFSPSWRTPRTQFHWNTNDVLY